jgi:hypothetical protein
MRAPFARAALRAYPPAYRKVHEQEILGTLLDLHDGGRTAGLVGVLDLVGHGALLRLGGARRAVQFSCAMVLLVAGVLVATNLLVRAAPVERFGGVPWVPQVATPKFVTAQVSSVPVRLPRARAVCPTSWLSVTAGAGSAGGMESSVFITMRNDGPVTCALGGTPTVTAYGAGSPARTATSGPLPPIWGGPTYDAAPIAAPHHTIFEELFIQDWCDAVGRQAPVATFPSYDTLSLSRAGGWQLTVPVRAFGIPPCSFVASPFATTRPPPEMPVLPFDQLFPRLRLPSTFSPSTTVTYDVVLHNPTDRVVALTPCPAYQVTAYSGHFRFSGWYVLNCRSRHEIPPHGVVTFQMKLRLSRLANSHRLGITWLLNSPESCTAWSNHCPLRSHGVVHAS